MDGKRTRWIDRRMKWKEGWMERRMNEWMRGRMNDGWKDGWMDDRWRDICKYG